MDKSKKKVAIISIIVLTIVLIVTFVAVNFTIKVTLMSDRKDTKNMLEELWYNFNTDYRNYMDLPYEEVNVTSEDGLNLKGFYYNLNPNSKKVVIINHGYTANHFVTYQFTDVFFEEGYNVLLIDMRSHGESEGDYASYGYNESKDIGNWVKWLKDRVGNDVYIGLHGQSMGAATVMLYGGEHPDEIKFVIEDCGFTTAKEAIKFQFGQAKIPFWPLYDLTRGKIDRKYGFNLNEISPEEVIINSTVPTLFIHGDSDNIVPTWMSEKMFNEKKGPKDRLYIVEGADHMESYSKDKETYKNVIREFLRNIENN